MFLDASAIVAIIILEPGHRELAHRIDASDATLTSPVAFVEAALAIARDHRIGFERARTLVERFLERTQTVIVPVDPQAGYLALDAYREYGKGRHRARLNFGDCFAYAMAKQHGVPLLYKGDAFVQTDLA